jgi:predicted Zn-dependent peptidase
VPVVTVDVTYDVGSRVEPPGKTGLAHLFEHLMFEGSLNVPKGGHFDLVSEAGGVLNGTTSEDRTNYFETLPASRLDLALYLEADRMHGLALSQEKLDNQREAVKEEKRLRIDNQPYGTSYEAADALAYDSFAYKHPVIGSMEDLDHTTVDDLANFFSRFYAPANAVLCIAGDIEPAAAFAAAEKHFGKIPFREPAAPFEVWEPPQRGERRQVIEDSFANLPALQILFKAPPRRTREFFALLYAEKILMGGESGRLWRTLVKNSETALTVAASADERRGPCLFRIFAVGRSDVSLATLEKTIWQELESLASSGPSDREMSRARRMLASDMIRGTQTTQALAFLISEYALFDRDASLWKPDFESILEMTPEEVTHCIRLVFTRDRSSCLHVLPAPSRAAA